jgi:hypothetical protein
VVKTCGILGRQRNTNPCTQCLIVLLVMFRNDVVVSKTFHRYTVRAKRGTAQGMRDNKQGGHAPRYIITKV